MSSFLPQGPRKMAGCKPDRPGPVFSIPLLGFLSLLLLFNACDIPTEIPKWDQRWILPADDAQVEIEEVLPEGIALSPDRSAFEVTVDPIAIQESLGDLCTPCVAIDGMTTPKPPFQGSFQELAELPASVVSAEVVEGRVRVEAHNGFGFDPIRPAAGATGTITLSLYDRPTGGALLDQIEIHGSSEAFPPGSTLTRNLSFVGQVEGALRIVLALDSPMGDPVTVDVTQSVTINAEVQTLDLGSVVADLSGQAFVLETTDLELEDLDEEMVDRIQAGALDFEIQNPWGVGASVLIAISGPFPTIQKPFAIPAGHVSIGRVEFTGDELREFLGKENVTLSGTGTVNPGSGHTTLTPGQTLVLETRLDLIIRVGGGEDQS